MNAEHDTQDDDIARVTVVKSEYVPPEPDESNLLYCTGATRTVGKHYEWLERLRACHQAERAAIESLLELQHVCRVRRVQLPPAVVRCSDYAEGTLLAWRQLLRTFDAHEEPKPT